MNCIISFAGSYDFMYDFPHANDVYGVSYPQGAAIEHVHSAMHHCQTQSIQNAAPPRFTGGADLFSGDFTNRTANNYSPMDNFASNTAVVGRGNLGYGFPKHHQQPACNDAVVEDQFGRATRVKIETFPQLSHWTTPIPSPTPSTGGVTFQSAIPCHQVYPNNNKGTSPRHMMVTQV